MEDNTKDVTRFPLVKRVLKEKPEFANHIIEEFDENMFAEMRNFATLEYWCDNDSINVFDVVGTRHPDYQGMSWLDFLQYGKRMVHNLSYFEANPGYYLKDERKFPQMSFIRVNGRTYVDDDGNHRTCIARFFFYFRGDRTNLHGIKLKEYVIDQSVWSIYLHLKNLLNSKKLYHIEVKPRRKKTTRRDVAGWMAEHYDVFIEAQNHRNGLCVTIKNIDDVLEFINRIDKGKPFKKVLTFLQGKGHNF